MMAHQSDPSTRISAHTLIDNEHNLSFEDEELDDDHSQAIDQTDGPYPPPLQQHPTNGGGFAKALVLYDFNGKKGMRSCLLRNWNQTIAFAQVKATTVGNTSTLRLSTWTNAWTFSKTIKAMDGREYRNPTGPQASFHPPIFVLILKKFQHPPIKSIPAVFEAETKSSILSFCFCIRPLFLFYTHLIHTYARSAHPCIPVDPSHETDAAASS